MQGQGLHHNRGKLRKPYTEVETAVLTALLYLAGSMKGDKMNLLELEFSNKVDLKALNLTIEDIQNDLKLLDKWGFDFNRNILSYIHEVAEAIRYNESEN